MCVPFFLVSDENHGALVITRVRRKQSDERSLFQDVNCRVQIPDVDVHLLHSAGDLSTSSNQPPTFLPHCIMSNGSDELCLLVLSQGHLYSVS